MTRLLTTLVAASGLALVSTAAFAQGCSFGAHTTMKLTTVADEDTVAMSTFDGDLSTVLKEGPEIEAVTVTCPEGDPICLDVPGS